MLKILAANQRNHWVAPVQKQAPNPIPNPTPSLILNPVQIQAPGTKRVQKPPSVADGWG